MADVQTNRIAINYEGSSQIGNVSYPSLPPPNSEPPSPASPNPAPLGTNSKSKAENTVKPFRTHSDYRRPKVSVVNDDSEEEEETEQVISNDEIEENSSDDEDDIEMKKVGVRKPTKKHHSPDEDGVALQLEGAVQMSQAREKGLSEVPEEIRKVYRKAFPFVRRWWDEGISSTHEKAINKLNAEIEKFNRDHNSKLAHVISPEFDVNYEKAKKAAVKDQTLDENDEDAVKKFRQKVWDEFAESKKKFKRPDRHQYFPQKMILDNIQAFKNQLDKIDTYEEGTVAREQNIKKLAEGSVVFIESLKKAGIDYKLMTPSHIKIKIEQLINESPNAATAYLACLEALRGPTPEQMAVWNDVGPQVQEFFDLTRQKKSAARDTSLRNAIKAAEQKNTELVRVNKELDLVSTDHEIPIRSMKEILSILEIPDKEIREQKRDALTLRVKGILLLGGINGASTWIPGKKPVLSPGATARESLRLLNSTEGDSAKQSSSASGAGPSTKIGSAATNATSSAKPSAGINPTSRVSNAKASSAELPTKSSSPAKAASSARVGSSTNESGADEPLFVSEEESFTESLAKSGSTAKRAGSAKPSRPNGKKAKSVPPRQDAPEPATRRSATVPPPTRPSATAPAAPEYILEALESVESDIDLDNLDSQLNDDCIEMPSYENGRTEFGILEATRPYENKQRSRFIVNAGTENRPFYQVISGYQLAPGGADELWSMEEKHSKFDKKWCKVYVNDGNGKRKRINIIKKLGPCVQVPRSRDYSKRKPDTYIRTEVHKEKTKNPYADEMPLVNWLTKSEIVEMSNKRWGEAQVEILTQAYIRKRKVFEKLRMLRLHPDTGKPLSEGDRINEPWLFPDAEGSLSSLDGGGRQASEEIDMSGVEVEDDGSSSDSNSLYS